MSLNILILICVLSLCLAKAFGEPGVNDPYLVQLIQRAHEHGANFYEDNAYSDFVEKLIYQRDLSTTTVRLIKLISEEFKRLYQSETNIYTQNTILGKFNSFNLSALNYANRTNNKLVLKYVEESEAFIQVEVLRQDSMKVYRNARGDIITASEAELEEERANLENMQIKTNDFLNRMIWGISEEYPIRYNNTRIFLSSIEVEDKVERKEENVSYISRDRKKRKAVTITVDPFFPTEDSAAAVRMATEVLLESSLVNAIYFEDSLKIPRIDSALYRVKPMGAHVLLTPPLCARLFQ